MIQRCQLEKFEWLVIGDSWEFILINFSSHRSTKKESLIATGDCNHQSAQGMTSHWGMSKWRSNLEPWWKHSFLFKVAPGEVFVVDFFTRHHPKNLNVKLRLNFPRRGWTSEDASHTLRPWRHREGSDSEKRKFGWLVFSSRTKIL